MKIQGIDKNCEVKKSNIDLVKDYKSKIWDLTWICDSDRILGAIDKRMTTNSRGDGTPEVCSGIGP
jgi:hypothetical protein